MKEKVTKLINVKSIVTFILTGVFSYLTITKHISTEQFMPVFTMCISFFFGSKVGKDEAKDELINTK